MRGKKWVAAAASVVLLALLAVLPSRAQPLPIVGHDPFYGPICAGPLGPGPCAAVANYIAMQNANAVNQSLLGGVPLQQLGHVPGVGPICAGPLGPGPCALILEYLRRQSGAWNPPPVAPNQLQVASVQQGVGPVCNGPFGAMPCAEVQQLQLDSFHGQMPSQGAFGVSLSQSAANIARDCAGRAGLSVTSFVACTGQRAVLTDKHQEVLGCAVESETTEQFAACAAAPFGFQLSDDQRTIANCAMESEGDRDLFLDCATGAVANKNLTPEQKQVLRCAESSGGESGKFVGCAARHLLGRNASKEQRIALQCAAESGGDFETAAICAGANMIGMQLNAEQQIAVQCVVSTGGQPYAAAGCMASRLTARELLKCASNGIGGKDGCFGDNNDLVGKNGWVARTFGQIAGGPNSVVNKPDQIWGGDNSFVRNPSQMFGGSNSFVRNPAQIWGGPNSVFNNPGQLLSQPKPVQVGSVGGKRICLPWC